MNIVIDLSTPIFFILLCIGSGIGWILWRRNHWQFRYWLIPIFLCYTLLLLQLTVFPIHILDKENLDKIILSLEEKGVQIIEKNVRISGNNAYLTMSGNLTVSEEL